jgi:molybdate transport system substrate-binding protein
MEIKLLSAGAVKPGIVKVIDGFRRDRLHEVKATFATAPAIRKRVGAGETWDVIIAPPDVLDDLVKAEKAVATERVTVGRIGVGVMVRAGAAFPKIETIDALKRSLLDAESIVYNQASTGIYLESLFARLGIAEQLQAKTTRYPDAVAVLDQIAKGAGGAIGFGAVSVIVENESLGLKLVGPLPPDIQNYTTYAAAVVGSNPNAEAARQFVGYINSPQARAALAAAGIEDQ